MFIIPNPFSYASVFHKTQFIIQVITIIRASVLNDPNITLPMTNIHTLIALMNLKI